MMTIIASTAVMANPFECTVEGTIEVQNFRSDIQCKIDLWNGGEGPYPCVKMNEVEVEEIGEGNGVAQVLNDIASDAEGDGYLTEMEVDILFDISAGEGGLSDKLSEFQEACTGGEGTTELDAEGYIFCKQLLAEMKMELGEVAKIVWYTPRVFFMVQILEDIQENLDHILARFDSAARDSFTVVCDNDPSVEIEFLNGPTSIGVTNGPTPTHKVVVGNAASAVVSVVLLNGEYNGPLAIPFDGCELLNTYDGEESEFSSIEFVVMSCANDGEFFVAGGDACVRANVYGGPPNPDTSNDFDEVGDCNPAGIGPGSFGTGPTGGVVSPIAAGTGGTTALAIGALLVAVIFIVLIRRKQ